MIKIGLVDEIQWRLDKLEESNKNRKEEIEKLGAEFDRSVEKIYDKLDRNNNLLVTSLISSLLTLVVIITMFVVKLL